jgi:hypothetical protein
VTRARIGYPKFGYPRVIPKPEPKFVQVVTYLFSYREIVLGDWKLSTDPDSTGVNVPSKITRKPVSFLIHESYTGKFLKELLIFDASTLDCSATLLSFMYLPHGRQKVHD